MDRLLRMDKEQFVERMQEEFGRTMEQVADAVNDAWDGNVISGSRVGVRDLMAEVRRQAFQPALQERIDATESSVSPPAAPERSAQAGQGAVRPQHAERQRQDGAEPDALAGPRGRK